MSTPVYKPIPADDYPHAARALQLAFGNGDDDGQTLSWLAAPDRIEELRGLYAGGELVTQLGLLTFDIQAGRGTLTAGGFGGVATPPEQRRRGHVATLLREACDELLERGVTVVLLDAFKNSFYRRYGWAAFSERRRYSGSPELFAPHRRLAGQQGRFVPAGEAQIEEFDAVYREALRGRFGPVVRTAQWWQQSVLGDRRNNAFLWRDEQDRARAYTIYRLRPEGDERQLRCREMVALDPQARSQLFAFLANHDAHVGRIQFDAPADAPVNALFPDPLECRAAPYFMLRVLDVAALLSAYRFPASTPGRLTLTVSDDWLAHNQGAYELEVDQAGAAQCRSISEGQADLRCDVRVLAQLVSRYVRPRTATAFGLLEAPSREALALADRWFGGLAPFFSDHF
jgi:predicted acetyltransferase